MVIKNKNQSKQAPQVRNHTIATYQGPLPPAQQLQGYEAVCTGAADRIIRTYENQVNHRHSIESIYVKSACRNSTLGLVLGFIIALVSICGAYYLVYLGLHAIGSILGAMSLAALVGVFVHGTKMKNK